MLEKLNEIERRYEALEAQLMDPGVYSDPALPARLRREHKELHDVVETFRALKARQADLAAARELAGEEDFRAAAQEEIHAAKEEIARLEAEHVFD